MSRDVLAVENIGKAYLEFDSELQRFARWFGVPVKPRSENWVLRHVSFRLQAGEAVGIVGQNGAGKSTLLKLVTGTARPSEGLVRSEARISALLELGLGFNPELSGRENARHAGGLMGIPAEQVEALMPEIEAFAEVGDYFDQPVRTYSSGMQMRVAFSVATAVRPDVLIVDEALAVGDAYFIHKSFQRIRDFREAGTSLLIVSHDATAIQSLCDRAILLEAGRMVIDGGPQEVLDYYNALISEKENRTVRTSRLESSVATESGSGEATFESLTLLDANASPVEFIGVADEVTLRARVRVHAPVSRLIFGYMIRDRLGQPVFGTNTHHTEQALAGLSAGDVVEFDASFRADLGPGSYSVSVALSSTETHLVKNYQWKDLALVFTVANLRHPVFVGVGHLPPRITAQVRQVKEP
jgi:lipopolysaccharide transport system ATP-binding protein